MIIDWKEEKIDIPQIQAETLETLSLMYEHIEIFYEKDITQASRRKQHRVRKHIEKNYETWIKNQLGGVAAYFDEEESDASVLQFLEQCHEEYEEHKIQQERLFRQQTSTLPAATANALWELTTSNVFFPIVNGDSARIELDNNFAFKRTLILSGLQGLPKPLEPSDNSLIFCISFCRITVEENCYRLTGDLDFYEDFDQTSPEVNITFTDVQLDTECYCATNEGFSDDPWTYLGRIALNIYLKFIHTDNLCNSLEHALLPLLKEIAFLTHPWGISDGHLCTSYPHFEALLHQHGYEELLPLIAALKDTKPHSARYNIRQQKLISTLCKSKYEPLWRHIWNHVEASQKDYPAQADCSCPTAVLQETKASIQQLMEQHGYEGSYPDFIKHAPLRRIHLEESYDMSYWVGMEKEVTYHIHCTEFVDESEYLTVQFLCGTSIKPKKDPCADVYSCLFNANGKRFFHTMHYDYKLNSLDGSIDSEIDVFELMTRSNDLEQSVQIAMKKNQLQKLTKEERDVYYGLMDASPFIIFFLVFLVGGLLFATCMTVGFMVITFLAVLFIGELEQFLELFFDIPWLVIYLFCFLGYGIPMGIITMLSKRK